MSVPRVLYLSSFLDATTAARYGYGWAQAGLNKKRGILASLAAADVDSTVVSPLLLTGLRPRYHAAHEYVDPTTGARVLFPATLRWIPPVNIVFAVLSTWRLMRRLHRDRPYDAVIFYNWHIQFVIPALLSKWLHGTRMILQYEDGLFAGAKRRSVGWLARVLEATCDRFLDGAIINSWNFRARTQAPSVAVIRGTVAVSDAPPANVGSPLVVMFSGKLDEIRGIDLFLDVCRILANHEGIELWITGDGDDHVVERVEKTVAGLAATNVRFFGFLPYDDYRQRLQRADVLVSLQNPDHPFSRFCFPSKLIEFMATGKIVVATDVSDVRRIADGRLVLTQAAPSAVADQLLRIAEQPEAFAARGVAARRWVQETCNAERHGAAIRRLLDGGVGDLEPESETPAVASSR